MDSRNGNCKNGCENSEKVGHLVTPPANSTGRENPPGCGLSETITISVAPTTGGTFDVTVQKDICVDNLKKVIAKKLKVSKERILLLHKERQLRDGTLVQNNISEGSTLTLLPSVETGLLSQRPEQTVMQALESLNDSQVNDFLSGKAPLNLTMRLGDHMMLIQLQLSSVTPSTSRKSSSHHRSSSSSSSSSHVPINTSPGLTEFPTQQQSLTIPTNSTEATQNPAPQSDLSLSNLSLINSRLDTLLHKNLNVLKRKLNYDTESSGKKKVKPENEKDCTNNDRESTASTSAVATSSSKKYNDILKDTVSSSCNDAQLSKREILSQIMESVRQISQNAQEMSNAINEFGGKQLESNLTEEQPNELMEIDSQPPAVTNRCVCKEKQRQSSSKSGGQRVTNGNEDPEGVHISPTLPSFTSLDTKALAEASRNLTQTLKQLSSEVLTCRPESTEDSPGVAGPSTSRRRLMTPGAIIETMQHHGKGVFSGTFSGTLNPALQDRFGRPKRDISTIIHILNDLLCATPHYCHRPSSSSSNASPAANAPSSSSISTSAAGQPSSPQQGVISNLAEPNSPQSDPAGTGQQEAVNSGDSMQSENAATRDKLERLRLVMEQSRERRRARREAKVLRGELTAAATPLTGSSSGVGVPGDPSSERNLQTAEDIDASSDILEISPPEPVLA